MAKLQVTFPRVAACVSLDAEMLQRPLKERSLADKVLHVLKLYSSNWTGALGRGDIVIPQRDVTRLVRDLLNLFDQAQEIPPEVSEIELFRVLMETRRLASVQDQLDALRDRFVILDRPAPDR